MRPGRVLVLGGRGFLGREITRSLCRDGGLRVAAPRRAELDLVRVDPQVLMDALAALRPRVVVNAAGAVTGSASELVDGNVTATQRLLDACARQVPGVRLVHLGSLAEYGPGHGVALHEDDDARPVSDYGRTKAEATRRVVEASEQGLVDGVVLRVANPLGPGQPPTTLAGSVVAQLVAGQDVQLGSLAGARDLVSTADVAAAVVAACSAAPARLAGARIVNVGTGTPTPLDDLVARLLTLAGRPGGLHVDEDRTSSRSISGAVLVADVARAVAVLDWKAQDDLDTALRAMLAPTGLLAPA